MEHWDEGVCAFRGKGTAQATPLILSAGVHGDETAPVRVLESLQAALQNRNLIAQRPCLIIIANTPALLNEKRFMKYNLNRLFGAPVRPPGYEGKRSLSLENHCRDFAELYGTGWHLDLHSTIKSSRHAHFALMPASPLTYDDVWAPLLAQHRFTALVRQHTPTHTFAHFTSAQLGFESFTLECGAVATHSTDVETTLNSLLQCLLTEHPFGKTSNATLQHYEVALDLIKQTPDFRFIIDETCENFATFEKGTVIAEDGGACIQAPCSDAALLFANSQVPVGDRAGLLLRHRKK